MLPSDFNKNNILEVANDYSNIHNSLIESFIEKNNIVSLKLLLSLSKYFNTCVEGDELYTFTVDLHNFLSISNINIRTFRANIKSMQESTVTFVSYSESGTSEASGTDGVRPTLEQFITILPYVDYKYNGELTLKLFKPVVDLVYDVKKRFSNVNLTRLMKIKNKHSLRLLLLLEYIDSFSSNVAKRKTYDLLSFNLLFGVSYKNFYEIERKILKPSKDELDQESSLSFIYSFNYDKTTKGAGRPKAVSLTIDLKHNNKRQMKLF